MFLTNKVQGKVNSAIYSKERLSPSYNVITFMMMMQTANTFIFPTEGIYNSNNHTYKLLKKP